MTTYLYLGFYVLAATFSSEVSVFGSCHVVWNATLAFFFNFYSMIYCSEVIFTHTFFTAK